MIYDGECGFCLRWVKRWQRATGDDVDYLASQSPVVPALFPEIQPEQLARSVQLIEPDGSVYSGAEAVFRSLSVQPIKRWLFWLYRRFPGFAAMSEWTYRAIADHRRFLAKI